MSEFKNISQRLGAFIKDYIEEYGCKPSTLNCVRWAFEISSEETLLLTEQVDIWGRESKDLSIRVKNLEEQLKEANEIIEFYGDDDNWLEPDSYVPYYTLWEDGNNIGNNKAREYKKKWGQK